MLRRISSSSRSSMPTGFTTLPRTTVGTLCRGIPSRSDTALGSAEGAQHNSQTSKRPKLQSKRWPTCHECFTSQLAGLLHVSIKQVVAQDAPESGEAVAPGDFLAFGVGAAGVGDGHFVDSPVALGDFSGDFGFEAEAIRFELDVLQDFPAKDFVTGLHVREFEIRENVGEQR